MRALSEYCDDAPSFAVVEITPALAKQIRLMRDAVKACHCYCMEQFDYSPHFMVPMDPYEDVDDGLCPVLEEWEGRLGYVILCVDDCRFRWRAAIRHTGICLETEGIDIKEVRWL